MKLTLGQAIALVQCRPLRSLRSRGLQRPCGRRTTAGNDVVHEMPPNLRALLEDYGTTRDRPRLVLVRE